MDAMLRWVEVARHCCKHSKDCGESPLKRGIEFSNSILSDSTKSFVLSKRNFEHLSPTCMASNYLNASDPLIPRCCNSSRMACKSQTKTVRAVLRVSQRPLGLNVVLPM